MKTLDQHTFDETLLSSGWIIDAGCRGFALPSDFEAKYNIKYFGLDIEDFSDDFIRTFVEPNYKFKQAALTNHSGETEAYLFGNGTGNFIKGINGEPGSTEDRPVQKIIVPCITLQDIYNEIGTDIDILKLDIEGSEYEILENIEPIPKQITVEFHEHCHKELHDLYIDKVMNHLCKDYHCNLYIRDWPRYKYMDCLFIRKDLI
jgi:FkbM family methyltransferase